TAPHVAAPLPRGPAQERKPMAFSKRRILVAAAAVSLVAGTGAVAGGATNGAVPQSPAPSVQAADSTHGRPGGLEIETVSSAPDMVTGGDVLVEVTVPKQIPQHRITVTLDGHNVTDAFT